MTAEYVDDLHVLEELVEVLLASVLAAVELEDLQSDVLQPNLCDVDVAGHERHDFLVEEQVLALDAERVGLQELENAPDRFVGYFPVVRVLREDRHHV